MTQTHQLLLVIQDITPKSLTIVTTSCTGQVLFELVTWVMLFVITAETSKMSSLADICGDA